MALPPGTSPYAAQTSSLVPILPVTGTTVQGVETKRPNWSVGRWGGASVGGASVGLVAKPASTGAGPERARAVNGTEQLLTCVVIGNRLRKVIHDGPFMHLELVGQRKQIATVR